MCFDVAVAIAIAPIAEVAIVRLVAEKSDNPILRFTFGFAHISQLTLQLCRRNSYPRVDITGKTAPRGSFILPTIIVVRRLIAISSNKPLVDGGATHNSASGGLIAVRA